MNGVASYCRPCALEASDMGSSCTSCPAGHYINRDSGTCHSCPPNTILKAHQPYGVQACKPCGSGTQSNKVPAACRASSPQPQRVPGPRWGSGGADPQAFPVAYSQGGVLEDTHPGCDQLTCRSWQSGARPQSWTSLIFKRWVREICDRLVQRVIWHLGRGLKGRNSGTCGSNSDLLHSSPLS